MPTPPCVSRSAWILTPQTPHRANPPDTVTAGIHIQIEHHLFPGISSDKLLPLCPIVEETCKEFGVHYKNFKSFRSILNSVHKWVHISTSMTFCINTSVLGSPTNANRHPPPVPGSLSVQVHQHSTKQTAHT